MLFPYFIYHIMFLAAALNDLKNLLPIKMVLTFYPPQVNQAGLTIRPFEIIPYFIFTDLSSYQSVANSLSVHIIALLG